MRDNIATAVFATALLLPVVIYVAGKIFRGVSALAYKILGVFCLATAAAFFAFVGWYFLTTGQLVSPGKFGIPSEIIYPTESLAHRVFVGSFNVLVGAALTFIGVALLRLKRTPRSDHPDEA